MRRCAFAVALFAFVCHATAQPPEPKKKADIELIQGMWWITGLESGGKMQPDKNFRGNSFTFRRDKKGGDVAVLQEGVYPPVEFTYSLDPAKSPTAIDLSTKGPKVLGIYKIDGDELTISMSLGGARPTEFATKAGGDTETFTLKRNRWERFSEKGAGFSVDFPGKPTEAKRNLVLPRGMTTTTVYTFRSEMERVSYIVTVTPLPGKLDPKDAESALDEGQAAILAEFDKAAGARIESEGKPFKLPAAVAGVSATREFSIAMDLPTKAKGAMRVRLFIAGERLIAQIISGSEEATKAPATAQFWNSFRTPGAKKKDPPGKE